MNGQSRDYAAGYLTLCVALRIVIATGTVGEW